MAVTKPSSACHKIQPMTGDSPVLDRPALRAALSHMRIEEPGTSRRFEEVLAERNGWSPAFAERVADEYCGFLFLAATASFEVTPSQAVDEAWHLHLSWPHYHDVLCEQIIGRPIEHRPGTGEPEDEARYHRQYEETLALYEQEFGKPPPPDIWPSPVVNDEEPESASELGRRVSGRIALGSLVASLPALAFGAPVLALILLGAALAIFLLGQPSPKEGGRDSRSGSGCGGGGCGGGVSGSSDDCASGCGGGSCGGGCGGGGD